MCSHDLRCSSILACLLFVWRLPFSKRLLKQHLSKKVTIIHSHEIWISHIKHAFGFKMEILRYSTEFFFLIQGSLKLWFFDTSQIFILAISAYCKPSNLHIFDEKYLKLRFSRKWSWLDISYHYHDK